MDFVQDSYELTRCIFLIGAVLALVYKKQFGVTPGGIIVPGLLACMLFVGFTVFFITLLTAVICILLHRAIFERYAMSSKKTTQVLISLSVVINLLELMVYQKFELLSYDIVALSMVVPGLIALSAHKYGSLKAVKATLSVTAVTYLLGFGLASLLPTEIMTALGVQLAGYQELALVNPYVVIPVSLLTSIIVQRRFGLRGGGYLIAPFFAVLLATAPIQAALFSLGVALSYGIVKVTQRLTHIIGLERFLLSLICAYFMVNAMDAFAIHFQLQAYRPSQLLTIIGIAVMTNDLSLQPIRPTLSKGFLPTILTSTAARWVV